MVYLAHIRTAFALSNGTYGSTRMHRDTLTARSLFAQTNGVAMKA